MHDNENNPLLSFSTINGQALKLTPGLPAHLARYEIPAARNRYATRWEGGYVLLHEVRRGGRHPWVITYINKQPAKLSVSCPVRDPVFYYLYQGTVGYRIGEHVGDGHAGQVNLTVNPIPEAELTFRQPGTVRVMAMKTDYATLLSYRDSFHVVSTISGRSQNILFQKHLVNGFDLLHRVSSDIITTRLHGTALEDYLAQKSAEFLLMALTALSIKGPPAGSGDRERAALVEQVLKANIHSVHMPALDSLRKLAGVSEKRLEEIFRRLHGCTVGEFFKDVRLQAIVKDIVTSDQSLTNIGYAFDYKDYANLSIAVKKVLGISPRELRYRGPF